MVITKDYDPFNPYENPELGSVLSISVYDVETNEKIVISDIEVGDILVEIVGGNECVYYDSDKSAFV